ncbi:hypothetical protein GDO81_019754 [Engystomops pustulosus]|uniref:Methyltransferase type 11 domain-containing protein n=1 Tax=Engystomops pustulosus TaxID=76066 RepID=A0AAV6ZHT4_ENGPU|nr:hypothetical protein GDO81_019754 [Engystomops pustulosus]
MMDSSMEEPFQLKDFDFTKHLEDNFSGRSKEGLLVDLSVGSIVYQLYLASKYFKEIIVLKVRDRDVTEMKTLVDTGKLHVQEEGNSDHFYNKDEKWKSSIQSVLKCDLEKENMTEPITLPPADAVISAGLLDVISKEEKNYIRYLRKFSRLLKPGGHLLLFGALNSTRMKVGEEKLNVLKYNEDFVRKALTGEGFIIENQMKTFETPLTYSESMLFIAAHKQK